MGMMLRISVVVTVPSSAASDHLSAADLCFGFLS